MDIHRAYRAPSDRLHSSIPGGEQQRHPEVLSDAEAKAGKTKISGDDGHSMWALVKNQGVRVHRVHPQI